MTYTNGPTYTCQRNISKKDFIGICDMLQKKIGDGSTFKPEGISEGGIEVNAPNNTPSGYKSLRLGVSRNGSSGKWYWVDRDTVMEEWSSNDDMVFYKNNTFTVFLKSLYGAPHFTLEELKVWDECFQEYGMSLVNDDEHEYPTARKLKLE